MKYALPISACFLMNKCYRKKDVVVVKMPLTYEPEIFILPHIKVWFYQKNEARFREEKSKENGLTVIYHAQTFIKYLQGRIVHA
jgi:hypothetical protein